MATLTNSNAVRTFHLVAIAWGCLLLAGCAGSTSSHSASVPVSPVPSDSIRVGDKITVRLTGVPTDASYINEIQIPDSGDITLPDLTTTFHAAGLRPGDLAAQITAAYKDNKIYTNPNITIIPEERYVNVGGDVRSPMRVLYTPDLTLLSAINSAGGFTEYAEKHHVRILRGSQVIIIDAKKAADTPGDDPVVYPGDQITVPRTFL
jgi:protein involved in polysaccharide export with SLBB domain